MVFAGALCLAVVIYRGIPKTGATDSANAEGG